MGHAWRFWSQFGDAGAEAVDARAIPDRGRQARLVCSWWHQEGVYASHRAKLAAATVPKLQADKARTLPVSDEKVSAEYWPEVCPVAVIGGSQMSSTTRSVRDLAQFYSASGKRTQIAFSCELRWHGAAELQSDLLVLPCGREGRVQPPGRGGAASGSGEGVLQPDGLHGGQGVASAGSQIPQPPSQTPRTGTKNAPGFRGADANASTVTFRATSSPSSHSGLCICLFAAGP